MPPLDFKTFLRQLMAQAFDARDAAAADNPAFEPEDRTKMDASARGLAESLLDASNRLKQTDVPGSLQRPLRRRSGRSPAWPYPPTAGRSLYLVHSALPILLKETAYRPGAPHCSSFLHPDFFPIPPDPFANFPARKRYPFQP